MGCSAKVIEHTINVERKAELITFEIELHRYILPEFNTHRAFSRNFQSSRAIPTLKQVKLILKDPALPVHWGFNNAGMSSKKQFGPIRTSIANGFRRLTSYIAITNAMFEYKVLGAHKQWANRHLEPFMYTKGVFTTSIEGLANFFSLRLAPDAQPEIRALAQEILKAYLASNPRHLNVGEWHLPYVSDTQRLELGLQECIRISAASCASVSYRPDEVNVEKIWPRLGLDGNSQNVHASPAEHQAMLCKGGGEAGGNFGGNWYQYRKSIKGEFKTSFTAYKE